MEKIIYVEIKLYQLILGSFIVYLIKLVNFYNNFAVFF